MSEPGPKPADQDSWLTFGAGFELTDTTRSLELATAFTWRTNNIVNDAQLRERYAAAGIEHLFFVFAVIDPHAQPPRTRFQRRGDHAFAKASFPDDPSQPTGDEFDAWLEPHVRTALETYNQLPSRR
jgi:hypothetical protein